MVILKDNVRDFYTSFSSTVNPKEEKDKLDLYSNEIQEIISELKIKYKATKNNGSNNFKENFVYNLLKENAEEILFDNQVYTLLLSAILKSKKVPCRTRCMFVDYEGRGSSFTGTFLCQVYDENQKDWYLVDVANSYIRLPYTKYKTASEIYLILKDQRRPMYNVSYRHWQGLLAAKQLLIEDTNMLMNNEIIQEKWLKRDVKNKPYIYKKHVNDLDVTEQELMYRLAIMLLDPDNNFEIICETYKDILKE